MCDLSGLLVTEKSPRCNNPKASKR